MTGAMYFDLFFGIVQLALFTLFCAMFDHLVEGVGMKRWVAVAWCLSFLAIAVDNFADFIVAMREGS